MLMFSIALAIATGVAMAGQSPTNAALGRTVGTFQASFTNFAIGWVICLVLVLTVGTGDLALVSTVPAWQLIGGLYGALIIVSLVIATPKLGVVLSLTMTMLGQLIGGMVVDCFGLVGAAQIAISPLRLIGCAVVVIGVFCVHAANKDGLAGKEGDKAHLGYMAFPLIAATIASLQPATNATLGATIGSIEATFVNFTGGLIILFLLTMFTGKGKMHSLKGTKPWQFTGGFYGVFGVVASVIGTPALGVSLWNVGTMLGQLVGGMAVDATGLFGVTRIRISGLRIAGAAIVLAGIVLVTVAKTM